MASDIFGVSGRAMMAALIAGERDPKALAELAQTRMRTKIGRLEENLASWAKFAPGIDRHLNTHAKRRNHVRQLEALGYHVTLEPAA